MTALHLFIKKTISIPITLPAKGTPLMIGDEEYVTLRQAAKLLQVTPESVGRFIRRKQLPAIKVGQTCVLPKESVLALASKKGLNP